MLPSQRSAIALVSVLGLLLPVAARAEVADKPAVEAIVRDYILAHPEIIEEAIASLRQKREKEAAAAQLKAIEDRREAIFDSAHQLVLGNPKGAITLVEFFDYNCGYCKRAHADMEALIEANPDLRIVLKEFPILSQGSADAARISVAVKDSAPDKAREFHGALLMRPGEATAAKALEIAGELGLDVEGLKAAADKDGVTANLREVQELAGALGISGTPSYVVGRSLLPGAAGYEALQGIVTAMRECGKTTC